MKTTASLLLILLAIFLAACQEETPEAIVAPEPTEETKAPVATAAVESVPTEETALAGTLPRVELLDECFVKMPEGADYGCLRVEVPEFHNEDNGRSIKLGVIRLLSTADTPAEPLLFAEGGPGGSNVDQAPLIAQEMLAGGESVYTDLLSTRDLVFFTQRGTLNAEPALMCSAETMGPVLEAIFAGLSAQERAQVEIEAIKTCYEEYTEAGVDFAAYNSVENAADINSMHLAMVCSDDPVTSVDDATSLDEVYSVVSEYVRSDVSSYIEICSYLNLPVLPDETDIPISSDVPVLLLSGAFDAATPAYNAEEVLATLPNGFSFEFPYGRHVQFLTGDACAESIVAAFIADPTTEPDASCIAEALPLQFALPAEQ